MDALGAISYRKGCYTGQETVARVHFRGHVNKTLRRICFDDGALPARGAELSNAAGAIVGEARSSALDDARRGVGIAMVRREVVDGAELRWLDDSGSARVARVDGAVLEG